MWWLDYYVETHPVNLGGAVQAWASLILIPVGFASAAGVAAALGFTVWPPALLICAVFVIGTFAMLLYTLSAFQVRGWGDAIVSIEHAQHKQDTYGPPKGPPMQKIMTAEEIRRKYK